MQQLTAQSLRRARGNVRSVAAGIAVLALLGGCTDAGEAPGVDATAADAALPWPAQAFPELPGPPPSPEVVDLGLALFYDPILSGDGQTACGTCHSEFWGMSDALERSVGLGAGLIAGPSRTGPHVMRRNSQGLWNLAFRETLFWDGRTDTLEAQAIEPLLAENELGQDPSVVVDLLRANDAYVALFAAAFPDAPEPTLENVVTALAEFQRTFVSNRSLYDGYVGGDDDAMSDDMVEGMFRFAAFGCDDCHTPPLFEREGFADRGLAGVEGLVDEGRYEATGIVDDIGRFRIPTLRNASFTEPYFHNGSVAKLSDAVRHELGQTGLAFDDDDVRLVTTFIDGGLRDESREPQRPETVPSGLIVPIDGTTIIR